MSDSISDEDRQLAGQYYAESYLSLREVARTFDLDHRNLARALEADGIAVRPKSKIDPEDVRRLHAQGLSLRAMCAELHRSDITIKRVMRAEGLAIRPQGRPKGPRS